MGGPEKQVLIFLRGAQGESQREGKGRQMKKRGGGWGQAGKV